MSSVVGKLNWPHIAVIRVHTRGNMVDAEPIFSRASKRMTRREEKVRRERSSRQTQFLTLDTAKRCLVRRWFHLRIHRDTCDGYVNWTLRRWKMC